MMMTAKTFNENIMFFKVNYRLDFKNNPEHDAYRRMLRQYLKDFPDDQVQAAFTEVLESCQFPPKIADFAKVLKPPIRNQGKAAWAQVLGMLNSYGAMRNTGWITDGATAKAVRLMGGWGHLASRTLFELNGNQMAAAFEAAYEQAASEGLSRQEAIIGGVREVDWKTGEYPKLTCLNPPVSPLLMIPECPEPRHEVDKDVIFDVLRADVAELAHRKAV